MANNFWSKWLSEANFCTFPTLADSTRAGEGRGTSSIQFDNDLDQQIRQFCARGDAVVSNLFAVAWALVLKTYTGRGAVSFGLVRGEEQNKSRRLCSVSIEAEDSISTLLQNLREDLKRTESFRVSNFSDIPSFRDGEGRPFCNTALSIRGGSTPAQASADEVSVRQWTGV